MDASKEDLPGRDDKGSRRKHDSQTRSPSDPLENLSASESLRDKSTEQDIFSTRLSELSRATVRLDKHRGIIVRPRFLEDLANESIKAGLDKAAWEGLLGVIVSIERPDSVTLRSLLRGFGEVIKNHASNQPLTVETWKRFCPLLVTTIASVRPSSASALQERVSVLWDLDLLGPPDSMRFTLAHITSLAHAQSWPRAALREGFAYFIETQDLLNSEETAEALDHLRDNCGFGYHAGSRLFTALDFLHIRLNRISEFRGNPSHAIARLAEMRNLFDEPGRALPSSDIIRAACRAIDKVCEICVEQNRLPTRAVESVVALLAEPQISAKVFEIFNNKIFPHYRATERPVDSVLLAFTIAGDSTRAQAFQYYVIDAAIELGLPLEPFVSEPVVNAAENAFQAATLSAYLKIMLNPDICAHKVLISPQTSPIVIPEVLGIVESALEYGIRPEDAGRLTQHYLTIADFILEQGGNTDELKELHEEITALLSLETPPGVLSQLAQCVRECEDYSIDWLKQDLLETVSHWALFRKVQGASEEVEQAASDLLQTHYWHDSVPYLLGSNPPATADPRALEAHREIQTLLWRLMNPSKGFSAWTVEARRIPGEKHCPLVEFGLDLTYEVAYLNSSSIDEFPGNGFVLSGLRLDRALVRDDRSAHDPYHRYKENWSFAKHLEDWQDSRIVFTRGLIAITGSSEFRYCLPVANNNEEFTHVVEEHHTLIIFNDHFHNPACHVACAIPTQLFDKLLSGAIVPANRYERFNPQLPDIVNLGFSYEDLRDLCVEHGVNFIDLGWPSNLGGLCNSYPVASPPYHQWEEKYVDSVYKDHAEHIHKAFILNWYSPTLSPAHERALTPLRELHRRVYGFGMACLDVLDGFKAIHSLWHKGQTLARPGTLGEVPPERLPGYTGEEPRPPRPFKKLERLRISRNDDQLPPLGPYSTRRLRELYLWHQYANRPDTALEKVPIFRVSSTMDLWPGTFPVEIDAATLMLKTANFEIQLPTDGDGFGEEERAIWREYVMPYATSPNDFRFWARSSK